MKTNGSSRSRPTASPAQTPTAAPADEPRPVHFEFYDLAASSVTIAGTFNHWDPGDTPMERLSAGKWIKDLLLAPGTYEYRLVVDGRWMPDPGAPRTIPNPFGAPNSLLSVSSDAG